MKILLVTFLVAFSRADVSHLEENKYDNPVPQSSYAVQQGSVVRSSPRLTLPRVSGSLNFNSGYNSASAVSSNSVPSENGMQINKSSESDPSSLNSKAQFDNEHLETLNKNPFNCSQECSSDANEGQALSDAPVANLDQDAAGSNGPFFNFGANDKIRGQAGGQPFVSNSVASGNQQSPGFDSSDSTYQEKISGDNVDDSSAAASSTADASKYLYFFSAPEEEDEVIEAKYDQSAVPAKESTKIIFVKAPIYKNQATISLPAPQIEEKTLVYVLVRKHDGQPKVHFKEAATTLPSKPEVFFIRYKTQKEAEAAVAQIQSTHGASGQIIAHLPVGTHSVHNSASVDSRFEGSVNDALISSGGFSLDSLGANSFVGANVANRISEHNAQNGDDDDVQAITNQGLHSQTPTPVTFGHNTVNSLRVFGGGIAPSESADTDSASGTQQESSEESVSIIDDITTTEIASSATNYPENVEQRVDGSDNHRQEETTAGLYTGTKYKRFSGNKY
ncbi:unnamed protein product [Ceutorhynchus assimilis]|uniref:DUF243 domain-containing protein n=1 Tax=Ceutorhynchus assimilis TaxID=467358 RepID=A0A9N9QKI3_9CUCU|nr:unnamed protein product [Ceutorhynchus assimilis]